eukprot:Stramenopile-MAST_4_protein_4308
MSDTARFLEVLQNDFERIRKELCQLDAEHAEAGQKHDEEKIKATILQNGGFAEVNSRCQMGIQSALVAIAHNAVTEDAFKLMFGLGRLLKGQAKYDEALTWYETALAGFVDEGEEKMTAATYNNMASVYDDQGEYTKALAFYDKSLAINLKVFGPDHPSTARTYGNMASVYKTDGEYTQALAFHEKCLAIQLKTLGPDHPDTAGTYGNMASVFSGQGEYTKALAFYDKALHIELKTLGPEHPSTTSTYNNMAGVYYHQGEYTQALAFYDKTLVIDLKTLGPDHPSTATTYSGMATVYSKQGEYTRALAFYDKSLAIRLKTLGPNNPSTATTYGNMASLYSQQGEYTKALAFFDKSLAILLKTVGPDHPSTATTYNNMASVYQDQGEYTQALAFYDKVLAIRLKTLGPDHPSNALTNFNLGALYFKVEDYTQSLKHLELSLAINLKSFEPEHRNISMVKSWIAGVKQKIAIRLKTPSPDHPDTALTRTTRQIVVDDSLAEFLKGAKLCPNQSCRKPLENKEHYLHVRCPLCGTDMCYRCGNVCSSGRYVRRCDHCRETYVNHQYGRLVAVFSFACWLPFALAYSLLCLACTPCCYCLLVKVDDQQEALETGNRQTLAPNACKRVTKQLCALIVMPFHAVSQFAGCRSCACLMPSEEELEATAALDKMERARV